MVGRSNVGKSSLINALAKRNGLANTSKTPGRTQLLNCFALPDGTTMVDCPGYGYAKVSKVQRASMGAMIERYLLGRDELQMVMVLVDGEVGPDPARPVDARVAPVGGAAPPGDRHQARQGEGGPAGEAQAAAGGGCDLEPGDVVWVSAAKNVGIDRLRDLVRIWLSP